MDWDDLRYVLAVARARSALRAARTLEVNQSTVMRRIAQIEADLGSALFEARRTGQVLTPLGETVAAAAERIEQEVLALQDSIAAGQRVVSGSVRFTSSETLTNLLVVPCLRTFRKQYPGIAVELVVDDRQFDLARAEADVALRGGLRPEGSGIVAKRLPDCGWTLYCSHAYAAENGAPASLKEFDGHAIVGLEGAMANTKAFQWLVRNAPSATTRARSNSLTSLVSALKAGLGVGPLPCFVGDAEADLRRCFPPIRELDAELWLIIRENVKQAPHVRAFVDFLAAHAHGMRGQLAGA
jgi:DNA-binding transcriptional LysR family regulator